MAPMIQDNMKLILEEKTPTFYFEAQMEQKYVIYSDIFMAKNEDDILIACKFFSRLLT